MVATDLINAILAPRFQRNFILPNYTPSGWFECDVFEVTAAGYFREYEVKVTRADFFADAKKNDRRWQCRAGQWSEVGDRKHDRLEAADVAGPVQFWFVVPVGLVEIAEVPNWAGLIEVAKHGNSRRSHEEETKPAPRLHGQKCDPKVVAHARGICYWRFHRIRSESRP